MRSRRWIALATCIVLSVCAAPLTSWAQDSDTELMEIDAPVRVSVIDATSKTKYSKKITSSVRTWLKENEEIEYVKGSAAKKALKANGVKGKALRSSKALADESDAIAAALTEAGVDGVVLVNGRKSGRYLDVIVLSADGSVAGTGSKKLRKKKRARDSEVDAALEEAIGELVSGVEKRREAERAAAAAARAEAEAEVPVLDEEPEDSIDPDDPYGLGLKDEDTLSGKRGPLGPTFALEVSGLFAQRSVGFTNDVVILDHVNPFGGVQGRLDVGTRLGAGRLGLAVVGAYGLGSALAQDADLGEYTLEAEFASLQVQAGYEHALHEMFAIGVGLRGERTSATLDQNPRYTGHRYTLGGAQLGLRAFVSGLRLEGNGGVYAVIDAETSGGAYGTAELAPLGGFFAGARILYDFAPFVGLVASYEYRSLGANYDAGGGESLETFHVGSIGLRATLVD